MHAVVPTPVVVVAVALALRAAPAASAYAVRCCKALFCDTGRDSPPRESDPLQRPAVRGKRKIATGHRGTTLEKHHEARKRRTKPSKQNLEPYGKSVLN